MQVETGNEAELLLVNQQKRPSKYSTESTLERQVLISTPSDGGDREKEMEGKNLYRIQYKISRTYVSWLLYPSQECSQ